MTGGRPLRSSLAARGRAAEHLKEPKWNQNVNMATVLRMRRHRAAAAKEQPGVTAQLHRAEPPTH